MDFRDYKNGIYAFDAGYVRPLLAAIHMIVQDGRVAFIDSGSNDSIDNALIALNRLDLGCDAVDYVMLTHIHLDHAGGAGRMMAEFPNAKLIVHPRGAPHMAEPSKLVAGVTAVYGADYVNRVYGKILPIAPERIIAAVDGYVVMLAGREFTCLDCPGHARHHICIVDEKTNGMFTGDLFGLSYRELDVGGRQFIFPTTTPTQFDPEEMRRSVSRLTSFHPEAMYLTHYSQLNEVEAQGENLLRRMDVLVEVALKYKHKGTERHQNIKKAMTEYLFAELKEHGCMLPDTDLTELWATDLELNTQGLEVWLDSCQ